VFWVNVIVAIKHDAINDRAAPQNRSVKLQLRDARTKSRVSLRPSVRPSVRSFVCLFVRCVCQGRPSYGGERTAMLHRNLRGRGKNPGSTNKYTKFGQLIRKIIKKYCRQMSHFKAKMNQILLSASVRSCVRPSLRCSLTQNVTSCYSYFYTTCWVTLFNTC